MSRRVTRGEWREGVSAINSPLTTHHSPLLAKLSESSAVCAGIAGTWRYPSLLGRSNQLAGCGFWVSRAGKRFAVEL
jgi:hypothetical protein